MDAAVRRRRRDGAIECIIGGGAGKGLGFQRRGLRPVRRVLIVAGELAAAPKRIALEIVEIGDDDPGACAMPQNLAAQIGLRLLLRGEPRISAVAIDRLLTRISCAITLEVCSKGPHPAHRISAGDAARHIRRGKHSCDYSSRGSACPWRH